MSDVETIAVCSIKNPQERWIINLTDFDSTQHVRWEDKQDVPMTHESQPHERTISRKR
jgi:hypothetical protein